MADGVMRKRIRKAGRGRGGFRGAPTVPYVNWIIGEAASQYEKQKKFAQAHRDAGVPKSVRKQ